MNLIASFECSLEFQGMGDHLHARKLLRSVCGCLLVRAQARIAQGWRVDRAQKAASPLQPLERHPGQPTSCAMCAARPARFRSVHSGASSEQLARWRFSLEKTSSLNCAQGVKCRRGQPTCSGPFSHLPTSRYLRRRSFDPLVLEREPVAISQDHLVVGDTLTFHANPASL